MRNVIYIEEEEEVLLIIEGEPTEGKKGLVERSPVWKCKIQACWALGF